jgi:alkylated DNA repair dioxygenase AlkB
MSLFGKEKLILNMPDANVVYYPNFFEANIANNYLQQLLTEIEWQQDDIRVYGKVYKQPRLTALYGSTSKTYSYSNITMTPNTFTPLLIELKVAIEKVVEESFNTVLLNLYRNGQDSNGWHADNEKELGKNPIIASLSFGATRSFQLKHNENVNLREKILLQHGSLLLMQGSTQHYWKHQLAKTAKIIGERVNLTFRKLQ